MGRLLDGADQGLHALLAQRPLGARRAAAHNPQRRGAYRFLDRWVIPEPIEDVYEAIGDPLGYEHWWTDFVISVTGDAAPPEPGKRNELLVKAYLPYKVNFGLEVIEAQRPRRILSRLSKDFEGTGLWSLEETGEETVATLDWRPLVNHALIRHLTPLLRPLFRSNHHWAMRRGERQLREYLRST